MDAVDNTAPVSPREEMHTRKENKESVRDYYKRNKSVVIFRKVLTRVKKTGAVPRSSTVKAHNLPMTAISVGFAEWAGRTPDERKIARQRKKLVLLRHRMHDAKPPKAQASRTFAQILSDYESGTATERAALKYLSEFA